MVLGGRRTMWEWVKPAVPHCASTAAAVMCVWGRGGQNGGWGTKLAWGPLSPHDSHPATIPSWLLASLQWSPLSPAVPRRLGPLPQHLTSPPSARPCCSGCHVPRCQSHRLFLRPWQCLGTPQGASEQEWGEPARLMGLQEKEEENGGMCSPMGLGAVAREE